MGMYGFQGPDDLVKLQTVNLQPRTTGILLPHLNWIAVNVRFGVLVAG